MGGGGGGGGGGGLMNGKVSLTARSVFTLYQNSFPQRPVQDRFWQRPKGQSGVSQYTWLTLLNALQILRSLLIAKRQINYGIMIII